MCKEGSSVGTSAGNGRGGYQEGRTQVASKVRQMYVESALVRGQCSGNMTLPCGSILFHV